MMKFNPNKETLSDALYAVVTAPLFPLWAVCAGIVGIALRYAL